MRDLFSRRPRTQRSRSRGTWAARVDPVGLGPFSFPGELNGHVSNIDGWPMARKAKHTPGGYIYHVLNRSAGRIALLPNEFVMRMMMPLLSPSAPGLEAQERMPQHSAAFRSGYWPGA